MRRKDRKLSDNEARTILEKSEYGILSIASPTGTPYGVPLSFCVVENAVYFHCALEGHKLDIIAQNNAVSFCTIASTEVIPEQFGTKYESAIVTGIISEVFDAEKQEALVGLLRKYSPEHMESGIEYIELLIDETGVYKVSIDAITGKACKR
ncbi:MAG: pyridoxamine 5'-phosphate oxidase family protein [Reichenbachiella sp.]